MKNQKLSTKKAQNKIKLKQTDMITILIIIIEVLLISGIIIYVINTPLNIN